MSVIAYFDESGDDGLINCSSEIFILTATYMHASNWLENYEKLKEFRSSLKKHYNIPVKEEFHTAKFFTDKNPYREYLLSPIDKKRIIMVYANVIANLNIKISGNGVVAYQSPEAGESVEQGSMVRAEFRNQGIDTE